MKTELSFLLDLLLNELTPFELRKLIAERIKEVEANLVRPMTNAIGAVTQIGLQGPMGNGQVLPKGMSAAQYRDQLRCEEMKAQGLDPNQPPPPAPEPIVASPAAAMAMASRQQAIAAGISGKLEKGLTHPRKF